MAPATSPITAPVTKLALPYSPSPKNRIDTVSKQTTHEITPHAIPAAASNAAFFIEVSDIIMAHPVSFPGRSGEAIH